MRRRNLISSRVAHDLRNFRDSNCFSQNNGSTKIDIHMTFNSSRSHPDRNLGKKCPCTPPNFRVQIDCLTRYPSHQGHPIQWRFGAIQTYPLPNIKTAICPRQKPSKLTHKLIGEMHTGRRRSHPDGNLGKKCPYPHSISMFK